MSPDDSPLLTELSFLSQLFAGQLEETHFEHLHNQEYWSQHTFWRIIAHYGKHTDANFYRSWVQWIITIDPESGLLSKSLNRESYWLLIQNGLSSTSPEIHKYCLFIFRKSILLVRDQVDTPCVSIAPRDATVGQVDVEKYCTVFETIILGRYVNQVHECLKMVPKNCLQTQSALTTTFQLRSSWWLILFHAALKLENANGVQKIIGTFVMNVETTNIEASELLCKFFKEAFITWACSSQLYTTTICRRNELVVCDHGDTLSNFLKGTLQAITNEEWRRRLSLDVLNTLARISVSHHAFGYVLHGLDIYPAVGNPESRVFANTSLASKMFPKIPLSSFMRELYEAHLMSILGAFDLLEAPLEQTNEERTHLSDMSTFDTLSTFISFLNDPANKVFKYNNLADMCTQLTKLLQIDNRVAPSEQDLKTALSLIWKACEIQRHSAASCKQIIHLFTQEELLKLSLNSHDLSELISDVLLKISKLSRFKIHLWNPLTIAIRRIYFERHQLRKAIPIQEILEDFALEPATPTTTYLLDCAVSQREKINFSSDTLAILADETVGHACLFDIMNNLHENDQEMGRSIISSLMKPWISKTKTSGSAAFPKYTSGIQSILILAGKCVNTENEIREFQANVMTALGLGIPPIARYLFQWIALALYWKASDEDGFLKSLRESINEHVFPKMMVSLLRIGAGLLTHPAASDRYIESFTQLLPTFASFDRVAVRHEAQWTVPKAMDVARERDITSIVCNETYVALEGYIRSLKNYKHPPVSWRQEEFLPRSDQNLAKLFGDDYHRSDGFIWHGPTVEDLRTLPEIACDSKRKPYLPLGEIQQPKSIIIDEPNVLITAEISESAGPLQSKSLGLDLTSLQIDDQTTTPKADIILIASLIDSEYNLGGLSRVAEIYGCTELHMASVEILKSTAFTSTSTSSENHINIIQTPITETASFLRQRKSSGWTILGIEQTDSSKILGRDSQLPSKVVILMGAEKTGIPADLLIECDECIEIKQWGLTRSLNVQTAAATVLYEYRRQWDEGSRGSSIEYVTPVLE